MKPTLISPLHTERHVHPVSHMEVITVEIFEYKTAELNGRVLQ